MNFLKQNWLEVKETPNTGEQEIDLIALINELRIYIHCKNYLL